MSLSTIAETKRCMECLELKPIGEFRRRSRSSEVRHKQCSTCHCKNERHRRATKRAARNNRAMAKYMGQLKHERSDARVDLVCQAMLSHFGGFDGFCDAWGQYIDDAQQRGGIALVRALEAVVRLLILDEQNFQRKLDAMTTTQLQAMLSAESSDSQ